MATSLTFVILLTFIQCISCRDFYYGMFKRNDFLVAQDSVYKDRIPYMTIQADYGRLFNCPITYFRVVDRLGVPPGITTKVVRGGIGKKYIAIRIKSAFNLPISANIYAGCENKHPKPNKTTRMATTKAIQDEEVTAENATENQKEKKEEPEEKKEETKMPKLKTTEKSDEKSLKPEEKTKTTYKPETKDNIPKKEEGEPEIEAEEKLEEEVDDGKDEEEKKEKERENEEKKEEPEKEKEEEKEIEEEAEKEAEEGAEKEAEEEAEPAE